MREDRLLSRESEKLPAAGAEQWVAGYFRVAARRTYIYSVKTREARGVLSAREGQMIAGFKRELA